MDDEQQRRPMTGSTPRFVGKVIKSEAVSEAQEREKVVAMAPPRRAVLNAEEYDAHTTAKQIVVEAQKKAAEIKAEAGAEAERIKAEALRYKEEVYAKAKEEAKAEVTARSSEELARAKMQAGQVLGDSQHDALDLALKIAAKIIGRDLERDPEVLAEICATALEAARSAKAMILRVHPEDGKLLREKRARLMELIGRQVDVAVRDDADVERGGCVIQTEFGTIDGQLRTQFEMLQNLLKPPDGKKEVK